MSRRVLVVDDEKLIVKGIRFSLEQDDMEVDCAYDGEEALEKARTKEYDMILLDIMLPKIDGYGVCEVIRQRSQVPIIMLTALSDEENQIKGFEQQIDDYIPKPFSPKILLYKIAAIFRRGSSDTQKQTSIVYKDLCMDIDGFHLYHKGKEIVLTQKEFSLLRLMLENKGKVFTRQMLLDRLWDSETFVEDRIVDSHIKNIRKNWMLTI